MDFSSSAEVDKIRIMDERSRTSREECSRGCENHQEGSVSLVYNIRPITILFLPDSFEFISTYGCGAVSNHNGDPFVHRRFLLSWLFMVYTLRVVFRWQENFGIIPWEEAEDFLEVDEGNP